MSDKVIVREEGCGCGTIVIIVLLLMILERLGGC